LRFNLFVIIKENRQVEIDAETNYSQSTEGVTWSHRSNSCTHHFRRRWAKQRRFWNPTDA